MWKLIVPARLTLDRTFSVLTLTAFRLYSRFILTVRLSVYLSVRKSFGPGPFWPLPFTGTVPPMSFDCLPACLPACPSVCLSTCVSVRFSVYLCPCLFVCLFVCMSVRLSVYLPTCLFDFLSAYLHVWLRPFWPRPFCAIWRYPYVGSYVCMSIFGHTDDRLA